MCKHYLMTLESVKGEHVGLFRLWIHVAGSYLQTRGRRCLQDQAISGSQQYNNDHIMYALFPCGQVI